jgi:hypothetical protein
LRTTVETGYSAQALGIPAEVHNLDLSARKQQHLILSAVCTFAGLLLVGIGYAQRHPVRLRSAAASQPVDRFANQPPSTAGLAPPEFYKGDRVHWAAYVLGGIIVASFLLGL